MAKATRLAFSKGRLEGLPIPEGGQAQYHDTGCPGLCLRVSCGGSRTFVRYGKIGGRPTRVFLGHFPEMSVEQARKACRAVGGDIAKGLDPHAQRLAKRREHTLQGLWEHWLEVHAKPHKRSWKEDQRQYEVFLKPWGSRQLSSIHKTDVQALHAKIGRENGPYAANRMLALLGAMYAKAPDIGFTGDNPTKGIVKFKEEPRDRFLQGDEVGQFFQALAQAPDPYPDFFALCLLTGARRGNVQAMRWADLNLDSGLWRIDATEAKAGEVIVVPLLPQAVEILRRRHEARNGSEYVFPSRGRTGHLVEVKRAWQGILARAGLSDLRVHDLRRSIGSWMAIQGASLLMIGKALGHRELRSTAIYARLSTDPVRGAMTAGAEAMLAAGGVKLLGHDRKGKSDGETQGR
jgi:integrase